MFFLIGALVIIILIFTIGAGVAAKANGPAGEKERGDEMVKVVYGYLVLFVTLMMMLGGSMGAFMAAADIVSPRPYYQSFEEFKEIKKMEATEFNNKGQVIKQPMIDDEKLLQEYNAAVKRDKVRAREEAVNTLIKSVGWIFVPLLVFLFFKNKVIEK